MASSRQVGLRRLIPRSSEVTGGGLYWYFSLSSAESSAESTTWSSTTRRRTTAATSAASTTSATSHQLNSTRTNFYRPLLKKKPSHCHDRFSMTDRKINPIQFWNFENRGVFLAWVSRVCDFLRNFEARICRTRII